MESSKQLTKSLVLEHMKQDRESLEYFEEFFTGEKLNHAHRNENKVTLEEMYLSTFNQHPDLQIVTQLRTLSSFDVNEPDDYSVTALFRAVENPKTPIEVLQFYLDQGADVHYHDISSGPGIFECLYTLLTA